jgi:arylsulfatase
MSDSQKDVLIAAYLFEDLAQKDFDEDGDVHVTETGDHLGRRGAKLGGGVGLVVGLFAPPLLAATALGAVAGGVMGKLAKHRVESGIGEKMDAALPPGSGGVIAIYDSADHDVVNAALTNAVKKSVSQIDGMSANELKEGLAEAQAGMTG